MKFLPPSLCLCVLLLTQGPGLAAPGGQGGDQRPRPERPAEPAPDRPARPDDGRHRDDGHRPPKLSPEERKALRQQIHEATHDLYRPKQ